MPISSLPAPPPAFTGKKAVLLVCLGLFCLGLAGCGGEDKASRQLLVEWCKSGAEQTVDCPCLADQILTDLPAPVWEVIALFAREEVRNNKTPEAARATLERRFGRERAINAFTEFVIARESARSLCQLEGG